MYNNDNFTKKFVFHSAPSLLGYKCSNLFTINASSDELNAVYSSREQLENLGINFKILYKGRNKLHIIVYRKELLGKILSNSAIKKFLSDYGYSRCENCEDYLEMLTERSRNSNTFPHEIGIFLGYPLEDVKDFIKNKGQNFLISGYWKVYNNIDYAEKTFEIYNNCRDFLCNELESNKDIFYLVKKYKVA